MANSKNVLEATDTNFQADILGSQDIALVDFWAAWCGPCRMLAPTIETIADEFAGKAKSYKMNVDENPKTPESFNIRGIPTVMIFKGGKMVETIVGNRPKEAYIEAIQKHLA